MNPLVSSLRQTKPLLRATLAAGVTLLCTASVFAAATVPENLGPGLDKLVASRLALLNAPKKKVAGNQPTFLSATGKQYSSQDAVDIANSAIGDKQGRIMVMINLNGRSPFQTVQKAITAKAKTLTITAIDKTYRSGVMEGFIDVDDVASVATTLGVSNAMLEIKPYHNRVTVGEKAAIAPKAVSGQQLTLLGTAFDQGVTQHRIDTIDQFYNPSATMDYEGQGMQIGCLSDSFGATTTVTPATDVTNYDLPGSSTNPAGNTTPVFVYGDYASGTDEGRAMCQIVYKMAPKATVGFATADTGEVGFANSIRGLAGLSGYTISGQTFAADVICDDVGYSDEPFFEDGVVGNAVNDVAAAGVSYFSSAGNDIGTYDYDSDFRYVPNGTGLTSATNTALAGTNINLTNVPTNLYQGGFHNFNPNPGQQDVALTYNLNIPSSQWTNGYVSTLPATNFQWNDPYNGTAPNVVTTDFNLLTFDLEGNYISSASLVTNNISSNIPLEYGKTRPKNSSTSSAGEGAVQYLVARSAIPTASPAADHFRILVRGNGLSGIGPAEYFTYNTPNTKGHAMAAGCNGTAAYSVFRPSTEEYFTSPGPATVYFDNQGNRLATPDIRLQPVIAGADNANNSFFASDDVGDLDLKPNFSGTSAAAPHAAACALLALQAHGGPRTVTPAQMTDLLKRSTFSHDLDPNMVTGVARTSNGGKVTITIQSDLLLNPSAGAVNPNSISVSYVGPGSLATLIFNPQGTAATGGNTTGGNNGVDAATTSPVTYFSNIYPGLVFEPASIPFALGSSTGTFVLGTDVTASYSNQAPAPSVTGQYWTMTLSFPTGTFVGGSTLRCTVGHGPQHNRTVNTTAGTGPTGGATSTSFTQADLFGGEVLLPDGTGNGTGMTFSGTTTGGGSFNGTINNVVGSGYSKTEGFGFINAQTAVSQTVQ